MSSRREVLAEGLAEVNRRIGAACDAFGRPRDDVDLIVVTKTFPRSDIDLLAELGVRDVGESREQEARVKVEQGGLPPDLRWHFIGQLQSKKAAAVARWADVVHSVDRAKVIARLARSAAESGRDLTALVQVDLDPTPQPGRGGARPDEVRALVDEIAASGLRPGGVMAVAPLGADPREAFEHLAGIAEEVRRDHPTARMISAGMSADLEAAIEFGATHLRVGTAILKDRESHR